MFTHLHLHTEYSLLDGLSRIPDVMDRVQALGQRSVAMTDHGALYGAIDFYKEARERGLKPIIGLEAYIAPDSRHKKTNGRSNDYYHLTLLARDETGYRNLLQLTTRSHLEGFYYKPRMDKELLAEYGRGIIALSGCPSGEMHRALADGRDEDARKLAGFFGDIFDGFYLEVMQHDEPEINAECARVMQGLIGLSKQTGIPLVATNDSHYTSREDAPIHDVLLCIGTNSTVDDAKRQLKMHDTSYYVKSEEEMLALFPGCPEAVTNTQLAAEQCDLNIEFGRSNLPEPDVPPGLTAHEHLIALAREGLHRKYPFASDEVRARLQYELDVVEKTGFTNYFLVVHDIGRFCREREIMLGVRGSAAASIILYALDVTFIDPLATRLVFERFLHVDRKEPPDVDLDIPDDRRDEVIRYVAGKYGYDRVAQIITFGTMGAKAAIRDVGRALGMPYGDVDRVARLVPNALHMTLDRALEESPELGSAYEMEEPVKRLVDTARRLEGVARHASTHAAGVVMSREPLVHHVPLQRPTRGDETSIPTTQYAMQQVQDIGLLKMDFLGLANLKILGRAVEIIERRHGVRIDLQAIADGDAKTFEMLGRGDTFGVFQLESPGMRRSIQELRPDAVSDLIALVALYRPGPMQHIGTYCRAKRDRSLVQYPHPDLAEILDETYGVICYQDQVLFVLQKFAGYELKDADAIRKAMSKKIASLMQAEGEKFIAAATNNGYTKDQAQAIFTLIEPFAGYAFNKAHSAVYGTIAYQTAYLKANYPHEYMTAVLASADAHERIAEAVAECVRIGIRIEPPDVNRSGTGFQLEEPQETGAEPAIRFGLETVKNVGGGAAEAIVAARDAGGPFAGVEDFTKRVDLRLINRRALESLIKCGACDSLGDRGTLLANVERIVSLAQREARLKETGQSTMFDMFGDSVATPLPMLELQPAEVSKAEQLAWERELLGVYVSEHPFRGAAVKLSKHTSALVSEISVEMDGRDMVIAGMVHDTRTRATKAGKPFLVATVEDLSGTQEVTVWPDVYDGTKPLWEPGNILLMLVKVRERGDRLQIAVNQAALVQAADGSISHERFEAPDWLTQAVRQSAGVGITAVEHDPHDAGDRAPVRPIAGGSNGASRNGDSARNGPTANGTTDGARVAQPPSAVRSREASGGPQPSPAAAGSPGSRPAAPPHVVLRFWLHESDDRDADRARLDALIALIERYPGDDAVRLFVHANDGDRIELSMPPARACEELRAAGVELLAPHGGAEEIRR